LLGETQKMSASKSRHAPQIKSLWKQCVNLKGRPKLHLQPTVLPMVDLNYGKSLIVRCGRRSNVSERGQGL